MGKAYQKLTKVTRTKKTPKGTSNGTRKVAKRKIR